MGQWSVFVADNLFLAACNFEPLPHRFTDQSCVSEDLRIELDSIES